MRHKGVSKEEMAERMLSGAGRGFRRNGFAGIGVDGLAKAAGVTSGAFYSHFSSKENAFLKALEAGLDEVLANLPQIQQQNGAKWVQAFAKYYLDKAHRNDLECGCAMATLTLDVVRSGKPAHQLYEKKMQAIVEVIAAGLDDDDATQKRARAWALLGILVGGLNLARAMQSAAAAEEVASAVVASAVTAAGPARAI